MENDASFIEIEFPIFGNTVLYSDNMNHKIKHQYIFPSNLVKAYSIDNFLHATNDSLFEKLVA
jgi:hypothetical protein